MIEISNLADQTQSPLPSEPLAQCLRIFVLTSLQHHSIGMACTDGHRKIPIIPSARTRSCNMWVLFPGLATSPPVSIPADAHARAINVFLTDFESINVTNPPTDMRFEVALHILPSRYLPLRSHRSQLCLCTLRSGTYEHRCPAYHITTCSALGFRAWGELPRGSVSRKLVSTHGSAKDKGRAERKQTGRGDEEATGELSR